MLVIELTSNVVKRSVVFGNFTYLLDATASGGRRAFAESASKWCCDSVGRHHIYFRGEGRIWKTLGSARIHGFDQPCMALVFNVFPVCRVRCGL